MTFRLAHEGVREVRRSLIIRMAVIMPLACGGGLYLSGAKIGDWATYLIMGFFAVVAWYSYKRSLVRQKCYWDSFEIEVDERIIERRIEGYPPFRIERSAISFVGFGRSGDLEVIAGARRLTVPKHLVDIELLKQLLEGGASSTGKD